jgi:signal transduction histidine kinase
MLKYSYSKIQQVFLNILKNGAEAMWDKNTVAPRFLLRVKAEDTGVLIEIEDNGPGMTNDVTKRVFEPFFTTKKVGIGTGLGLYVSYFIVVEHHGGNMSVRSRPGKGTTFTIRLPIEEKRQQRHAFWESSPSPY